MPTDPHSNWTHLGVFLGLDVGFDAGRRRAGHAALVDGVLANCEGGEKENKTKCGDLTTRKKMEGRAKKGDFSDSWSD